MLSVVHKLVNVVEMQRRVIGDSADEEREEKTRKEEGDWTNRVSANGQSR